MAFRETGKNEFYNKLEPDEELKEKLLKKCFESVGYGSPYEEKEFSVRRNENMKKNKIMGFLKTSIAVACALVATGLVLYGVNKKGNTAVNKKAREGITKEILEFVKDKNPGIYKDINGEYFIKGEKEIILTKNVFKEKNFKKTQKNCYYDDGNLKEGYIEETFAGETFAVSDWRSGSAYTRINTYNKTTGVNVIKKDKNGYLSVKPKTYNRHFFIVDGLYFMIENESEEEGPVVLAPYAYYSYDENKTIEGWSLYDEGNYCWVTNVQELRDTEPGDYGFGVGVFANDEQFKDKPMISYINNNGEPDFNEGRWLSTYDVCMCVGIDFLYMPSDIDEMYENPEMKKYGINDGMYIIGDYVLKYDESELLYRNINESEYKKTGIKSGENFYGYNICVYDNNLYYDTYWEIRKVDLAANKNIKLYEIPSDEDYYLSIDTIYDDRIFINNCLWGTNQCDTLIYNIKTNIMEEEIEGICVTVEDGYVLIEKPYYEGNIGHLYTMYKIEDDKVKEEKIFIENGLFLKSMDKKFYYVKYDKKNANKNNKTTLYRCNLDGSDVEKLVEYKGTSDPNVVEGHCYVDGEDYEF